MIWLTPFFFFFYSQELYAAGVGEIGTDESKFINILNMRSFNQLREVFKLYERHCGKSIEDSIESECSGSFKEGLLAIGELITYRGTRQFRCHVTVSLVVHK